MRSGKQDLVAVILITALAIAATTTAIFSTKGPGPYQYYSIRKTSVTVYGKGLYKHMSADVAPQGIAQDYITLFLAVPLLILAYNLNQKGSVKGKYLLTGVLGYFLVTYLFYTAMAMYNDLFLVYVGLLGISFYSFIAMLFSFKEYNLKKHFKTSTPFTLTGAFLVFIAVAIAFLWLSIVLPPLVNGTVFPREVAHYTTLIVQGFDLGILLPGAFLCGWLWIKKAPTAYLLTPVYFVFLSILMTALTAKVIVMGLLGYNVVPVIFIIPAFNLATIISTSLILRSVIEPSNLPHK